MNIEHDKIDPFLDYLGQLGYETYWENYTLCVFDYDPRAMYSNQGVLRNNRWGFEHRFEIGPDGCYEVKIDNKGAIYG